MSTHEGRLMRRRIERVATVPPRHRWCACLCCGCIFAEMGHTIHTRAYTLHHLKPPYWKAYILAYSPQDCFPRSIRTKAVYIPPSHRLIHLLKESMYGVPPAQAHLSLPTYVHVACAPRYVLYAVLICRQPP